MADPLGFINSGVGAARLNPSRPTGARPDADDPSGFKNVLMQNLKEVNALQQDANRAIEDLQTGKRDDLEGVILATQKADTAFRMLQAVRNKVMDAYEELKQLRV